MDLPHIIDNLIGKASGGAIIGLDGTVWASTPGFYGNSNELNKFDSAFQPNSEAKFRGIIFMDDLFMITKSANDTIFAKNGERNLIACRCKNCIVLGYHDEQFSFEECSKEVIELAEFIKSSGLDC